MFEWLIANLATIIVLLVIAVVVVLIILKMHNDKKQGKHSCGGNCAGCNLCHHQCDSTSATKTSEGGIQATEHTSSK